jgi:hypothetical protein
MGEIVPLRPFARALVITSTGRDFSLSMRPALNSLQRSAVTQHPTKADARRQANRLMVAFPEVYVALVDETELPDAG